MMVRYYLPVFFFLLLALSFDAAGAQTPAPPRNAICKTGSDADLPEIKAQVADMATELKRLKQARQTARSRTDKLHREILALDQVIKPLRVRHKSAAQQAGSSTSAYALYKANWLDTGELDRLNGNISLRKQKHTAYKIARTDYQNQKSAFETLGAKYQYIARDLLDRDRDCAGARAALRAAPNL